MSMFRALREDEIECRIGTVNQNGKGVSLLLYKTARVDYDVLDETFGPLNWQCRYYECKGTLFCSIGIKNGTEWIWKDNAGAPSNMEAQKGEASDAMKRAGFVLGIGRELYTAPFIWVPASKLSGLVQQNNGKWVCYDRFSVAKIATEDGRITGIRIINPDTEMVLFSWKEI